MTLNTTDLAAALGISRQRVNELGRKGKIAREADGKWDADKVRAALGRNLDIRQTSPARGEAAPKTVGIHTPVQRIRMPDAPVKGTLAHAQLMHEQAKAAKAAMEAQRLEGKLIPKSDVISNVGSMIITAKTNLRGIGAKLAAELAAETEAAKCEAMVDREIDAALDEISRWQPTA